MIAAIWIAFLAYAALAIGLGVRASSRHDEGEAYWSAGRELDATSVGMSLSASFLSVSWSCVYAVQLFYGYGLGALLLLTVPWLMALLGIWGLAARYRSLPAFSQPQMVGDRFGSTARRCIALALAFVFLVWGGAEIWVAASLLATPMALQAPTLVLMIGLIVATYSLMGGFRAVVLTDRLQYLLVTCYIVAMVWLAWRGLQRVDGWDELSATAPVGALSGRPWTDFLGAGAVTVFLTLLAYLPGWLFETDLWLRVQAARDEVAARRGVAFAAVNAVVFVGIAPAFIGIAALVIFPVVDGVIPTAIGANGESIFPALVERFAPPWLQLLASIGLIAAAMSTIDTCTNVVALSAGRDLGSGGEPSRRRARTATLLAVAGSCLFALGIESLWDVFYLSSGVLTTAVALPVAAVLWPRASARMVTASSIGGFAATVLAYGLESHGPLTRLEPDWLAASGLGFVLWGIAGAVLGAAAGALSQARRQP